MRFIETSLFTRSVLALLSAESYRALQLALLLRPEQGNLIKGSGGLRKLRWSGSGRGKRGGVRIIYFWDNRMSTFYMLMAFAKNVQVDLTPGQLKILRHLVREEFE